MYSLSNYASEFNESWTFWSLTFQAHWDTTLFRLCKIYDQHNTSLNLRNLLDTIEANAGLFDVENFRARLKGNPFVDSLASGSTKPDLKQLQKDKEVVSESNPLVKALVFWRNNFFAHRSAKHVAAKRSLTDHYTFDVAAVDTLLKEGMRILNSYSVLFRALSYSTQIVGHDDYKHILEASRSVLRKHEDEVSRELDRFREKNF